MSSLMSLHGSDQVASPPPVPANEADASGTRRSVASQA